MIIDSHAHLLVNDPARYPPAPLSGTVRQSDLENPVTAERLLAEMDASGVERAVVVQRAHFFGYDNSYLMDSADRYPDRFTAVVMIDGLSPSARDQVRHWVGERGAVGVRLAASSRDVDDVEWLAGAFAAEALAETAALGRTACVHVTARLRIKVINAVAKILEAHSEMPIVLDHLTNVQISPDASDFGFDAALAGLAKFPNAYLKFSTINLRTFLGAGDQSARALSRLLELFPYERIMWGSDVGQSPEPYTEMVQMAVRSVSQQSRIAKDALLADSCARFYRLAAG